MKYKKHTGWSIVLMTVFCFAAFSPSAAAAQIRKKGISKKTTVKKTAAKKRTVAAGTSKPAKPIVVGSAGNDVRATTEIDPPFALKSISLGVVNSRASNLVVPNYPPAAKVVGAAGEVRVRVTIDERGSVISASAVSGHPLLRQAAEQAARESKFTPMLLSGQPVRVTGVVVYNFAAQ